MSSTGTIETRAGAVAYSDQGSGPSLLLLHATLHDRRDYDAVVPELARRFRVVAVDFPGHGESPQPGVAVTARGFADAVEDIVDGLDLGPVALIGNSVGGFAAARFAIARPEQCTALVLVQTGGFTAPAPRVKIACNVLGRPAVMRRVVARFGERYMQPRCEGDRIALARAVKLGKTPQGASLAASLWRSFLDPEHDLRGRASRIVAPTLVVWGKRDLIRPVGDAAEVTRCLPRAELVVLDTGHVPFVTDPAGFLGAVQPFLGSALAKVR